MAESEILATKACTKCGQVKPIVAFSKKEANRDGYNTICKKCWNVYAKEYREKNPEVAKRWSERNADYMKLYRMAHRDHYAVKARKRRAKAREEADAIAQQVAERNQQQREQNNTPVLFCDYYEEVAIMPELKRKAL